VLTPQAVFHSQHVQLQCWASGHLVVQFIATCFHSKLSSV